MTTTTHHASQPLELPEAIWARKSLNNIREAFREPHPFERKSAIYKPHSVPWTVYGRRNLRTAVLFFPAMALFFGWPFAVEALSDYRNGVYVKSEVARLPAGADIKSQKPKQLVSLRQKLHVQQQAIPLQLLAAGPV